MWAHAVAQPNIALIKYWGKRDTERNLPAAGSLSVTLETLWTGMSIEFPASAAGSTDISTERSAEGLANTDRLVVNGRRDSAMLARVSTCLDRMLGNPRPPAAVHSESNFPIAAGLASSSSAFAALVVAAGRAADLSIDAPALAGFAGAASGSAARSIHEGIVELRVRDEGIDVRSIAAASEWPLQVVIAITDEGAKATASGEAMIRSAATSPFYQSWIERQEADLEAARDAVRDRDFEKLGAVSEYNCLKMHSVMWTSKPPIVYWNEATVNALEAIRELQRTKLPVFFTIDAGPQVKAVCLPEASAAVSAALSDTAGVRKVIVSGLGRGARLLDEPPANSADGA